MLKKIFLLLLAFTCYLSIYAQTDSSHLRISLLTCSPGDEEIYEVFGHTAVRVIDSVAHTDMVYNYGTFEYGPEFEMQFMRGKLLYCLAVEPYYTFLEEYVQAKRSVEEQVLLADWKQKERLYYFLEWNAEPENKYYKYDFFFDNCATRIRDIFPRPEIFGKAFHYGQTIPAGKSLSFRDIINRYFYRDHWTRFGVNILLGSRIDKAMSNSDIMFLPDYLRDGIGGATVKGQKIATSPVLILPGNAAGPAGVNLPFILTTLLAILTIAGLCVDRLRVLGKIMSALLLFATSLLGCLILVMWFYTDHQGCRDNFNLLWCLPTNLIIAFFNPKGKGRYALIAMVFIFIVVLLHITGVQGMTIVELFPLLLALLFIYGTIYRNRNRKPILKNVFSN
ncbi:MAG: DUF4105 domain-containing protein [Chitinophagales bacterium]